MRRSFECEFRDGQKWGGATIGMINRRFSGGKLCSGALLLQVIFVGRPLKIFVGFRLSATNMRITDIGYLAVVPFIFSSSSILADSPVSLHLADYFCIKF